MKTADFKSDRSDVKSHTMRNTDIFPIRKGKSGANAPIIEVERDASETSSEYIESDVSPRYKEEKDLDNHNSGGFSNANSL
jgi:hypothetical protein